MSTRDIAANGFGKAASLIMAAGMFLALVGTTSAVGGCSPAVSSECMELMSDCIRRCVPGTPGGDSSPMPQVLVDQRSSCERTCQELCDPKEREEPRLAP